MPRRSIVAIRCSVLARFASSNIVAGASKASAATGCAWCAQRRRARHCRADGGADNCDRPGDGERGEQGSEIVGHVAADTLFGQKYSAFFDAEWKRSSGQ
ncbi:hypothetical protein [Bosea thiooxidans]